MARSMTSSVTPDALAGDGALVKLDRPSSLADQAYQQVKASIIQGHLAPGTRTSEVDLARSLGISRSPLREALRRLQEEGLVEAFSGRGIQVTELTPQAVREVYEVRVALERMAAALAAGHIPHDAIDKMGSALKEIRSDLDRGDTTPFNELELPFHDLFVMNCGNDLLIKYIARVRDQLARVVVFAGALLEHTRLSYEEHVEILAVMKHEDADELASAVEHHLRNVADRIISSLQRS